MAGILRRGHGILGIPRSRNSLFVIATILAVTGLFYSYYLRDWIVCLGVIGAYLVHSPKINFKINKRANHILSGSP